MGRNNKRRRGPPSPPPPRPPAALWLAAKRGDVDAVRSLLSGGEMCDEGEDYGDMDGAVDVDERSPGEGTTPLFEAASAGHTEVVRLLIDADADMDAVKKNPPVIMVEDDPCDGPGGFYDDGPFWYKNEREVEGTRRAPPQADGLTPLDAAVACGRVEVVRTLVQAGADANFRQVYRGPCKRRYRFGSHYHDEHQPDYVEEFVCPVSTAIRVRRPDILRELLRSPGYEVGGLWGYSQALTAAVDSGVPELLAALLDVLGAQADGPAASPDCEDHTLLTYAVRSGSAEMVTLLVAVPGLDVNRLNARGFAPLGLALGDGESYGYSGEEEVDVGMVRELLSAPTLDVNRPLKRNGWAPLDLALDHLQGCLPLSDDDDEQHAWFDEDEDSEGRPLCDEWLEVLALLLAHPALDPTKRPAALRSVLALPDDRSHEKSLAEQLGCGCGALALALLDAGLGLHELPLAHMPRAAQSLVVQGMLCAGGGPPRRALQLRSHLQAQALVLQTPDGLRSLAALLRHGGWRVVLRSDFAPFAREAHLQTRLLLQLAARAGLHALWALHRAPAAAAAAKRQAAAEAAAAAAARRAAREAATAARRAAQEAAAAARRAEQQAAVAAAAAAREARKAQRLAHDHCTFMLDGDEEPYDSDDDRVVAGAVWFEATEQQQQQQQPAAGAEDDDAAVRSSSPQPSGEEEAGECGDAAGGADGEADAAAARLLPYSVALHILRLAGDDIGDLLTAPASHSARGSDDDSDEDDDSSDSVAD